METPWQLIAGSASVAIVVTIGLFLRFIASENSKNRDMWQNYMSRTTDKLDNIAGSLREVVIRLEMIVGPRGDVGPKGEKGEKGDTGEKGGA